MVYAELLGWCHVDPYPWATLSASKDLWTGGAHYVEVQAASSLMKEKMLTFLLSFG